MKQKPQVNRKELRIYIAKAGFEKIADLSKASGINRKTIGEVLSGKANPSTNTINKLIDCLNIPFDKAGYVFFNTDLRNA